MGNYFYFVIYFSRLTYLVDRKLYLFRNHCGSCSQCHIGRLYPSCMERRPERQARGRGEEKREESSMSGALGISQCLLLFFDFGCSLTGQLA